MKMKIRTNTDAKSNKTLTIAKKEKSNKKKEGWAPGGIVGIIGGISPLRLLEP